MATLYAPHAPSQSHLQSVMKYMKTHGSPSLRAIWRWRAWWALEGSHRIAAAKALKLTPVVVPVTLRSRFKHDTGDILPDLRVSSLLTYYDGHDWWTRYSFKELAPWDSPTLPESRV